MKKLFLTLIVAAMAFTACQNPAATTPAAEGDAASETITAGDLAYVRVDYVIAESDLYKSEGVALNEKTKKAQESWAKKEQSLQNEATQLQQKYSKGLITTADAQKQQQSIEKRIANYQTNTQKEAQALDEENFVLQNRTQDLMRRAIKEVNADGKYKMIVDATALLDAAEGLDISAAILAKFNELYAAEKQDKKEEKK